MMENRPPLTSPDGSSNRNTPGSCLRPLYSQDTTQEDQVEDLIVVKIEDEGEPCMRGDEPCKEEETPPEISSDSNGETVCAQRGSQETSDPTTVPLLHPGILRYPTRSSSLCTGPGNSTVPRGNVNIKQAEERPMKIKEEEIPPEISTGIREIQTNIIDEREDGRVRIKEEEIPMEISTGGCSNGNTPEECSGLLYSRDSTQEQQKIPQDDQEESLVKVEIKEEPGETFVGCNEEETPPEIGTDGRYRSYSTQPIMSTEEDIGEDDVTDDSSDENPTTPNIHPPLPNADSSAPKCFPCPECKKSFSKKENFLSHQRIHRGEDPLSCQECGKSFIWKRQLVIHQRSHTGEKPLSCLECGKCFSEKSYLARHQKCHSTARPFACSQCNKCFTDRTRLNTHLRTHTGEKPFSCSECGERFSRKSSLIRHEKFHRGEKPYSCMECGKCFTERANLVTHYRIHTGDRPYSCAKCKRAFKQRSDLVRHEKVHMRYQWHFCPECGQQFALEASLAAHLSTHAGEAVPASENGS